MADALSRIKQYESQEEIDDFPKEFVGIVFNKEDVNWSLKQLKKYQIRDTKLKIMIENLSGKRKETFKKVLIQNHVLIFCIMIFYIIENQFFDVA